ncbi:hypothetical protein QOZ84_01400 [Romboutsia sedimentorum]|uniref:DUF3784 domain-containing protein n=1 Tax=Romboutsia sedimentorum TaxID=1368474 RepID=A0ABT7E5I1_9FIRM|nr:hypothetical protein [Romboutsia sedimentorum]MDK2562188.1 hypothetical protein [Romboutsia sedimentorum]
MELEQLISMLFVPVAILISGILIIEKNYMFGIDDYLIKFRKKHNVEIDKATYCRFEGIQKIKMATSLLVLYIICFLLELNDLSHMIKILGIWAIIVITLDYRNKKKLIKTLVQIDTTIDK